MALDRASVVRTALRVLDDVGLEGLTLRRIATEMDVKAPALYWHFASKQDLVDEMATALLRGLTGRPLPPPGAPWLDGLLVFARDLRRMLLAHRDGAKLVSGTHLTDDRVYGDQERALRAAADAGVEPEQAVRAYAIVYAFTIGFTIEEQAVHPRPGERDRRYNPAVRAARVGADRPLARRAGARLFDDFDARFEDGLQVIARGLAA